MRLDEFHYIKGWLAALRSEVLFSAWSLLSAASTLSTFFIRSLSGKPRLISALSAIVGFAWANLRVFRKQEIKITAQHDQISTLQRDMTARPTKTSQLRIIPASGSRYYLRPISQAPSGDFDMLFLEFHLMVENSGERNSVVNGFRVEIRELGKTFDGLQPITVATIPGRRGQHGVARERILTDGETIRINAEDATKKGILIFSVRDVSFKVFMEHGLHAAGIQAQFQPLHARLVLTDTTGESAVANFDLCEE